MFAGIGIASDSHSEPAPLPVHNIKMKGTLELRKMRRKG